jgi:uncharacterized repeat protein (TIGR01451 family)
MRIHHRRRITFAALLSVLLTALAPGSTLWLWHLVEPVEARPGLPRVSSAASFGSAQPCLSNPDVFVTSRGANTLFFPTGSRLNQSQALDLPALQSVTAGGAGAILATLRNLGAVYGLAYDDGRVSGRERLFAAAFTKRLVGYGPAGPGGIYVLQRIGAGWSLVGSFTAPGALGASHAAGSDGAVIAQIGKTSLGDLEVSPDGRGLFVVNIGLKRIERFDLTGGAIPLYQGAIPIDLARITSSAAAQADLWPFALEFYPFPAQGSTNQQQLIVGLTDSAERGLLGGRPQLSGSNFVVSPQVHVLTYNLATGGWWRNLSQDLGNSPTFNTRHDGSTFGDYGGWNNQPDNYPVKGWNPWRGDLGSMAAAGQQIYYPQPWLSDIEFLSFQPAPGAPAWDTPYMVLGLRDRVGDQVYNANLSTGGLPPGEHTATAQGDTLYYRYQGGGWVFQSGEAFDDNSHYGGPYAHIENHMGALASVPNDQSGVAALGESLAITSLGGQGAQELRIFNRAAGPNALGVPTARPELNNSNTHMATKASNLGDLELLCSYALIGGRVWNDSTYNGSQDAGESGIAGVALELFDNSGLPASAPALAGATTDSQGRYLFAVPPNTAVGIRIAASSRSNLAAQGYRSFTWQHQGGSDTADSDANPSWGYIEFAPPGSTRTGNSSAIAPLWREGEGRAFDIGLTKYQPTGSVGDRIWSDADGDGVQDPGEAGVAGVTVNLESSGGAATFAGVNVATATDASGLYRFRDLAPGLYRVRFSLPGGMRTTLKDQGGDDARDSDVDASSAYATVDFALTEDNPNTTTREDIDTTRDFGLVSGADVEILKSGPAAVLFDENFSYTLEAINHATVAVANVVVGDTLPATLPFVSATPAPTSRVQGNLSAGVGDRLTWNLGTLAPGERRAITLRVQAAYYAPGSPLSWTVDNCATIAATPPDALAANNSDCVSTEVRRVEVGIVKLGPSEPVLVGDLYDYTLRYTNLSANDANLVVRDVLPSSVGFVAWKTNPGGVCAVTGPTLLTCPVGVVAAGASGEVVFSARANLPTTAASGAAWSVTNRGNVGPAAGTTLPGDLAPNNNALLATTIQAPDLRASVQTSPRPLPVGEPGVLRLSYANQGAGLARSSVLTITHALGASLGAMPAGCSYSAPAARAVCAVGDLPAGSAGLVELPLRLPATPADGATFASDAFTATVTIGTATPERAIHLADNSAADLVEVVRPNLYVTVAGPGDSARLAWGSGFVYEVAYGNLYRAAPDLTRAAGTSVLSVTLPADVEFLSASLPPTRSDGRLLVWELGTLAPQAAGGLRIAVRTSVPAGTLLRLAAVIGTATPGDDLSDNQATLDTTVVQPPVSLPAPESRLRLAIHSELDPLHGGADGTDAIYLTPAGAASIAWPAGEVLDFAPRLERYELSDPGWPLEYRARVTGWSVESFSANGRARIATAPDSRGVAGCRGAGAPPGVGSALVGCAYGYAGAYPDGRGLEAFLPAAAALREAEMAEQAHVYWTQPPAPPMRPDVYLFTLTPLAPPRLAVAVEVEVWLVNACPDFLLDPLSACGAPVELPTPARARQAIGQSFGVTLVVPRSVVGPAGKAGR